MRKYLYLLHDVICILIALLLALYLRNGWMLIEEGQPQDIMWTFIITAITGFVVFTAMGNHTSMWRYTSLQDILRLTLSVTLVVLLSNSLSFLVNRLEEVPRSVPLIHWALAIAGMTFNRLAIQRLFGTARKRSKGGKHEQEQHVIVIGVGPIADIYLQFISQILHNRLVVEGFVDDNPAMKGRAFQKYPVLGNIQQLPEILERLHVHGIRIDKIVITQDFEKLGATSQALLNKMAHDGLIELVNFHQQIGPILPEMQEDVVSLTTPLHKQETTLSPYEPMRGPYPYVKRFIDITGALTLLIILSPLLLVTSLLVMVDVGLPLFFWQKRPGKHHRSFRLYKFRTMRHATRKHDEARLDHKARDKDRMSFIGMNIRRFRLDELPQLYHIITGDMSFIGPRPLLPDDQPENGEVRLSVRPGITGWAQIHGGDALTPEQKLVLDHWYIRNMSLRLDIEIALKTLAVAIEGDKPAPEVINRCRAMLLSAPTATTNS
jgi:lipopolysaccharide/colanic/teichoic acid biosynthesis glycosyltransferase